MKQLRILTGEHAGVHLELNSTRYVIGADEEADIQLLDWKSAPVVIEVEENDVVSIAIEPQDLYGLQPDEGERFEDFVPRRIGDIVLCVGPVQAAWPSDFDLISRLSAPAVPLPVDTPLIAAVPVQAGRSRKVTWTLSAMLGMVMMTAAVGTTLSRMHHQDSAAAGNLPPVPLKTRVESAIADLSLPSLEVVQADEHITVRGLVRNASDAAALRARLDGLKSERIVHAYASAADIARDIAEGIGLPGLEVEWRGNGEFVIAGKTADLERLNAAAARIRADLGPLVKRVEVVATEQPRLSSSPISAALDAGALQYVQTRDGVKHLSLSMPAGNPAGGEITLTDNR